MLLSDFIQGYANDVVAQPIINVVSEPGIGTYSTIYSAMYQVHGDNLQEIVKSNDRHYDEQVSPVATAVLIDVVSPVSTYDILDSIIYEAPRPMVVFLNASDLPASEVLQVEAYMDGMNVFVR